MARGSLADYTDYLAARSMNPAPRSQPLETFAAPDPVTFARTPGSLYLQGEQQKAIQRGAAARGTLLTGGLQKRLQENAAGLASQDFNNAFDRARSTYLTNRDTASLNRTNALEDWRTSLAAPGPAVASFTTPDPVWPTYITPSPAATLPSPNPQAGTPMPIPAPFVAPTPAWAQSNASQPEGDDPALGMSLNARFAAQDEQKRQEARTEAAAAFARQVASAREQYEAQNRIPMGTLLNQARRPPRMG